MPRIHQLCQMKAGLIGCADLQNTGCDRKAGCSGFVHLLNRGSISRGREGHRRNSCEERGGLGVWLGVCNPEFLLDNQMARSGGS